MVELIKREFVALAVNSAVERKTEDSCGEFLRKSKCMAGSASGAVFVVSASGENLGQARPYGADFEIQLQKRLDAWRELDSKQRKPDVKAAKALDPIRREHELPSGALVVRVSNRPLEPDSASDTGYRYVVADDYPEKVSQTAVRRDWQRYRQPADDFLWITQEEWKSLIPARPEVGASVRAPEALVQRILQYHLVPSRGLGEGTGWRSGHVLDSEINLTVQEVSSSKVVLRLEGFANFKSFYRVKDDPLIYNPYLFGQLEFDREQKMFTRFDVLALGDLTGSPNGENQLGRRLGTHPLAVAFELIDPKKKPAMRLHPRGLRDHPKSYWHPRKPHD